MVLFNACLSQTQKNINITFGPVIKLLKINLVSQILFNKFLFNKFLFC